MATNKDYDFFEALPEKLTCPICMKALSEPHLVNCCETVFCKGCLDKWSQNAKTCPHCRSTDFSHMLLKQQSRKIGELKVYCPNKKHGCECVLKISEYGDHLSTTNNKGCSYVTLSCPFNCKTEVFRGNMPNHTQKQCPKRTVTCIHCKLLGEYQFITGTHVNQCPEYPLPCPQGCDQAVIRKDLETHRDTCPLQPVLCPFSESGCKARIPRRDLEKHIETNMLHHITTLAKSHAMLKEEHEKLKKDYEAKLNAIVPLLKDGHQQDFVMNQMYTILAECSTVTLGGIGLKLALSESNNMSGHHFIILAEPGHPEYKFKLEWLLLDTVGRCRYRLMLYSLVNDIYPAITGKSFSVKVELDETNCLRSANKYRGQDITNLIADVCCGKPLGEVSVSVDKDLQLLGKLDTNSITSKFCIKFIHHQNCRCSCHLHHVQVQPRQQHHQQHAIPNKFRPIPRRFHQQHAQD